MKITCTTCQAKYTISDDKVRGKTVKIKCKKCGSSIVVNGDAEGAAAGGEGEAEWSVNVAEGDQRSLTIPQIAALHRDGVINDDTYVWKEGMADWLSVVDVPEIAAALGGGAAHPAPAPIDDDMPTRAGQIPADLFALGKRDAPMPAAGRPSPAVAAAPAQAARRVAAPRGKADLFGGGGEAAQARPIEEDVQTRVARPLEQADAGGGIGARNENSTLFSLAALAGSSAGSPGAPARREIPKPNVATGADASGMIDIRTLQASLKKPEPTKNKDRVDDLMSMGGGSPLFMPDVSAPMDLTAPSPVEAPVAVAARDAPTMMLPAHQPEKSKAGLFAGIAVAVVLVLGVGGYFAFGGKKKDERLADNSSTTADTKKDNGTTAKSDDAKPTTPTTTDTTTKPADAPTASGDAPSTAPSAIAAAPMDQAAARTPEQIKRDEDAAKKRKDDADAKKADDSSPKKDDTKKKPDDTKKPDDAKPADPPPAAGGGSDAAFDRGAALSALGNAANGAASCKKPDGPTGSGRVSVTFAPSGNVTSSVVDGAPFAGTSVGGCVAAKFRSAHVPPFGGGPVTVRKSFSIN